MIKDNQKVFNRINVILDTVYIAISYFLAWYIKFESGLKPRNENIGVLSIEIYFRALYWIVPGYLLLYYWFGLYTPRRTSKRFSEVFEIFKANVVGGIVSFSILFMVEQVDFSKEMMLLFAIFNAMITSISRVVVRKVLRYLRKKGYNLKYILLVGYSRAAEEYINRINMNPQWGYVVRGILDDHVPRGTTYKGVRVLGTIDNLEYILPENKLDEISVTLSLDDYGRLEQIVSMCEKSGVHTKFIPDYNSLVPSNPYTEDLMGLPVINIRYVPLSNTLNAFMKRMVDIFGSGILMILSSPVLLLIAIVIKCTSPGPVIFKQVRVGLHNKEFKMYKFRSMVQQTEADEKKGWTVKGDPRVTRFGSFLRKTSLDELPQLFNIFLGQMSLVGPRPERPQFVEKFKEEIPRYMIKHQVRPGLTGWAQVNGYRGDTSIYKRIEYDIFYIENWTMGMDFRILFMTIFKGFVNKNAY